MSDDQKAEEQIFKTEPQLYADLRTKIFYSNYTALTMTPDEVIFRFAGRDLDDPGKALEIARLVVSPAHAKRILTVLANIVKIYEKNFGELTVDPVQRLTSEGRISFGVSEPPTPQVK